MIFNKNGLMVVHTTKADSNLKEIDNVYLERDGTAVGCGGKTVVMVSPVREEVREKLTDSEVLRDSRSQPMAIPSETVKAILKDLPADKKFGGLLEHCDIQRKDGYCKVEMTDGKRRRSFEGKVYPREYLPYKNLIGPAIEHMDDEEGSMRVVLNKKRLLHLLDCINRIAPDASDDDYLFVSFTKNGDIVLRGENYTTGQRFVACMWSYKGGEGEWLELNEWERSYIPKKKPVKKKKAKKGKKFKFKLKRKSS